MDKLKFKREDIALFHSSTRGDHNCKLKNFLSFLKCSGIKKPIRFAYVHSEGPLLSNLSLKDNILLDSIPNSLSETKEFQLKSFLKNTGNNYLISLFNKLEFIEELPGHVDNQERKITALIKALLQESDFILLDSPEKYLSNINFKIFKNALLYLYYKNNKTILIATNEEKNWVDIASIIVKRDCDKKFYTTSIAKQPIKENFKNETQGHLEIYNLKQQKKSA